MSQFIHAAPRTSGRQQWTETQVQDLTATKAIVGWRLSAQAAARQAMSTRYSLCLGVPLCPGSSGLNPFLPWLMKMHCLQQEKGSVCPLALKDQKGSFVCRAYGFFFLCLWQVVWVQVCAQYVCMHVQVTGQPQGHPPSFLTGSLLRLKTCRLGQAGLPVSLRNLPTSASPASG